MRGEAQRKADARATQRIADSAAENATLAADMKRRLLLRLKRTEEKFPMDATEVKVVEKGKTVIYRLRDLTAAYKDLTDDIVQPDAFDEPLYKLLQRWDDASER